MASTIQYQKGERPELAKHDSSVLDLAFAMDCTGKSIFNLFVYYDLAETHVQVDCYSRNI